MRKIPSNNAHHVSKVLGASLLRGLAAWGPDSETDDSQRYFSQIKSLM